MRVVVVVGKADTSGRPHEMKETHWVDFFPVWQR